MNEPSSTEARPACVVFATRVPGRPPVALLRAVVFARRLRVPLVALHVVPPGQTTSRMLFPQRAATGIASTLSLDVEVKKSEAWTRRLAPDAEIILREGSLEQAIVELARARRLETIVLAAKDVTRSRDAMWLARETGAPVLVARAPKPSATIVAATDLRDPTAPVVRGAAALASRLEAPLVVVHNVPSLIIAPLTTAGTPVSVGPSPEDVAAQERRLERTAKRADGSVEAVILSGPHTAEAVLGEAHTRGADIVAVGAYGSGWLERIFRGSTAEDVLDRARRSVLIIPVHPAEDALAENPAAGTPG